MSHSDLAAEVLRLDAEATPKPWHEEHVQRFADDATGTQYTGGTGMVFDDDNVLVCDTNETDCADAALIAHYRTAAPALAREVQRLTERGTELEAEMQRYADIWAEMQEASR